MSIFSRKNKNLHGTVSWPGHWTEGNIRDIMRRFCYDSDRSFWRCFETFNGPPTTHTELRFSTEEQKQTVMEWFTDFTACLRHMVLAQALRDSGLIPPSFYEVFNRMHSVENKKPDSA